MVMKEFVKSFPKHIDEAIKIGSSIHLNTSITDIDNIVISGQGGSAIGGVVVKNLLHDKISIPIFINRDYKIPSFVNNRTLFIASSYSGNTEETISALNTAKEKTPFIFCICSGGKILKVAQKHSFNYILIPSGGAPRGMLCYSIVQLLFVICKLSGFSLENMTKELLSAKEYLMAEQTEIIKIGRQVSSLISNKMPFIYAFPEFEGVAIRFKQQLNENSKRHACYNIIPEMNHNEIVPWINKNICVVPIFIKGNTSNRNEKRMEISISKIKKNVDDLIELKVNNSNYLIQYLYFIHIVDWISIMIAEKDNIDPDDIRLINSLKKELKVI